MKSGKIHSLAFAAMLSTMLGGCATLAEQIADKEDLLAASGFEVLPANDAQRIAELKTLPANQFITKTDASGVEYVYADPVVCQCLYRGDRLALETYRNEVLKRKLRDEEQMGQLMYDDDWDWRGWNWDGWGGPL